MNGVKVAWRLSLGHLKAGCSDIHMLGIIILVITLVHMNLSGLIQYLSMTSQKINVWQLTFLLAERYTRLLLLVPLLLVFAKVGKIDGAQLLVLIRSGRRKWCAGQVGYIILLSILYVCLLHAMMILFLFPYINWQQEWGDVMYQFFRGEIPTGFNIYLAYPRKILDYFLPIQAAFFTSLLLCLVSMWFGLVILLSKIIFDSSKMGMLIVASWIILDATVKDNYILLWFNPASWVNLVRIRIQDAIPYPTFNYIIIVLVGGLILLGGLSILSINQIKSLQQYRGDIHG